MIDKVVRKRMGSETFDHFEMSPQRGRSKEMSGSRKQGASLSPSRKKLSFDEWVVKKEVEKSLKKKLE